MDNTTDKLFCTAICAGVASLAGFGAMAALMVVGDWTLLQGLFAAAVIWLVLTTILLLSVCGSAGPTAQQSAEKARAEMAAARARVQGAGPLADPDNTDGAPKSQAKTAPAAAAPQAAAPKAAAAHDTRPASLAEARGGKADDLKKIKGVGPKLEKILNALGFYHFDQIASWRSDEVAWADQNIEGFKGRASRDNWVEQAKALAAGGDA